MSPLLASRSAPERASSPPLPVAPSRSHGPDLLGATGPDRANPLARGAQAHKRGPARSLGAAVLLTLLAGCGAEGEADAADRAARRRSHPVLAEQTIGDLVVAFTPPSQQASSAVQDDWLRRRRAILARMREGDEEQGELLLQAFQTREGDPVPVRSGLLEAATLCAPRLAAPVLDELVRNYGEDLALRTEACRFFGEAAPEAALETLGELLFDTDRSSTAPPDEALLDGWLRAHRALGRTPGPELAHLATDLQRDQASRHLAIRTLGEYPSKVAMSALEEVMHESSGNIYMRRLAAQSMIEIAEREEYCPIFVGLYEREVDLNYQLFLESMIEEHCR